MSKRFLTAFPLLLLASLSVVSCDIPSSRVGADGYSFGDPSFERTEVKVQLVTYKTRAEFMAAAKKRGVDSLELQAFTELQSPFDRCIIHVMDPKVQYQPEFIGHELAHCFYGQWHTSNSERN